MLALSIRRWKVHRTSALLWIAFIGWGVVVSITALDPLYTWIGTPDRHFGLAAWVLFGAMFLAGQSIAETEGTRWLHMAAVVAGLAIGIVAGLEWLGAPVVELTDASSRLGGPFGSPAYLGATLCLLIPLALSTAADDRNQQPWRILAGVSVSLCIAVAIGTQTRAAWIGLAAAAVATFPIWRRWFGAKRLLATSLVVVLGLGIAVSPFAERLTATFSSGNASGRIGEWRIGLAAISDHPVTGTGFEGYRIAFPSLVDTDYERKYGRAVIPDRAHNGALDVGITSGFIGLALYAAAALWLVRRGLRAIATGDAAAVGVGAAIIGYLFQQQLLFPSAEVDPIFWLVGGVLVARTERGERSIVWGRAPYVAGALAVAVAVALWFGARDVLADRSISTALTAQTHQAALESSTRAVELRPDSIRYWLITAEVTAATRTPADLARAIGFVESALARSPSDPAVLASRADLQARMAQGSGTSEDIAAAISAWRELSESDPNNADHRFRYGSTLAAVGDWREAQRQFVTSADLAPRNPAPLISLAFAYLETDDLDLAIGELETLHRLAPDEPSITDIERRIDAGKSSDDDT